jgi:hypothetical protein
MAFQEALKVEHQPLQITIAGIAKKILPPVFFHIHPFPECFRIS